MINAVIAAVGTMLVLSLSRVHVVIAIIVGALVGGLTGGLGIEATLQAFNGGLGGGATVALSYALLGAFAVAIAKSGLAHALADKALLLVDRQEASGGSHVKWLLICLLGAVAIASQNILPIHIAFIPLLVPPLLYVLTKFNGSRFEFIFTQLMTEGLYARTFAHPIPETLQMCPSIVQKKVATRQVPQDCLTERICSFQPSYRVIVHDRLEAVTVKSGFFKTR